MDKIIPGLGLALISALTFVAYQHPNGYRRIIKPVRVLVPALLTGCLIWDIGTQAGYRSVIPYIPPEKLTAAQETSFNDQVLTGPIVFALIAFVLYLEFLAFLPALLAEKKPPEGKDQGKNP